ncbi:MAG: ATP-dependent dethiobiotin synthetase BioD [Alphaproteobacteria bacterium]|nr:ATP-dependent dethiobiotin synthetase BioD [Alphaproteobacteria bacterium]
MTDRCIITGTDTGVGKTMVASMLMLALGAGYWKPVQSGLEGGVDTKIVQKLTGLPAERFLEERYVFSEPLSPHRAAELDNAQIDVESFTVPAYDGPLLIEGAGGLMVPLTRENLFINLFRKWNLPVILVARMALGTINHTLLSLEALWARDIPVYGLIFVGEDNPDTIRTIADFSKTPVLGRLPWLDSPDAESLTSAFGNHFRLEDFVS